MKLQYVLEYRDEADALGARFPGEPPRRGGPHPAGTARWFAAACVVLTAALVILLSRDPLRVRAALMDVDRSTHPVFISGVVLAAIGGALCVCPVAYALALRRARRPIYDSPVTIRFDDAGINVGSPEKELSIAWEGVVAVAELNSVFVIRTVGDVRLTVPKRACETPAAVEALAELLRNRVPPLADVAAAPRREWGMAA